MINEQERVASNTTMKSYCKELFQKDLPHKKKKKKDPRNHPFPTILSAPPDDPIHLISLLGAKQIKVE